MPTMHLITTYKCPNCRYKQFEDPHQPGWMARQFPEFPGIGDGQCPACFSGKNDQKVKQISMLESISGTDLSQLGQQAVATDAELEATEAEEYGPDGRVVMVKTGETRFQFNPATGKAEPVDVYAPKKRPVTARELKDLKEKRDRNGEAMSKRAVKNPAR